MKRQLQTATKVAGLAILSGAILAGAGAAGAETKWKLASAWGGGPLHELGAKGFAANVEMLTNGAIKIQVFPSGTLGKSFKVTETVKNNVAQVGHHWPGYDWGKDTTAVAFGSFAGSMDAERTIHWLYEGGGKELWAQWRDEKFGVVGFPCGIRTAEAFLHSRKAVRTMADLKGLKFRTAGAWQAISKQLGAAPVSLPGGEVYTSLERGVIDATEWGTLYENISVGFHKIAKYVIIPGVHQPSAPFECVVNKAAWGKLSARDQGLVKLAGKMTTIDFWTKVGHEDAKALDFYRKAGNEIIELDESVQKEVKKMAVKWGDDQAAKNPWFAKVWNAQKAYGVLWKDAARYRNTKG
ncbi:MAG TPA: TRAP transporter substrate-binding protein DctP [Alphaproteobacteria bacterium]|jgi:TRAP-type mannitol/chloroaromatic compound transport system substrate-binding protein|nr:TRAP transporter substrate-binding protein DctP [Alphaproteobacteria bacterium]